MALQWHEQLSVGNDLIESDHKYLIDLINQSELALATKSRAELTTALDKLSRYSTAHFSMEEKVATAVGYGQVDHLNKSHEALLLKLDQVKQEIGDEWTDASAEHFCAFLRTWLINHVIKEDMLLKPFLKKFSPRFDPR